MIDALLEKNLLPDSVIRFGIRRLLAQRLREEAQPGAEQLRAHLQAYVEDLKHRPIAENTHAANEQHYEVPTPFYQYCLGKHLKYSGCLYARGDETLDEAEASMLSLYAERAKLFDGQEVLELGCGWGSVSLWMAERFPRSRITGVSNSKTQKTFIDTEAMRRGLRNLRIITCDINSFDITSDHFDRVVSIEMFEHMKNYERLLANVARWLKPSGLLFVHIFTHKTFAYHFIARDSSDWMSRYFFTGGQMPSDNLLIHFQDDLKSVDHWIVSGTHYQKTAEHWLENMDLHREEIMPLFAEVYGEKEKTKWWAYWRIFYMACAELWGYRDGTEWFVSHYLFQKPPIS
jgi:cyclopropane-fatty-acyl-phospholipid synthase